MAMSPCYLKGKSRVSQWLKVCQEDASNGVGPEDSQLLRAILVKRTNKEDSNSKSRSDVITKKILRAARHFFDMKIEENVKYKKRKGKCLFSFLTFTDHVVDEFFNSAHLRLLGVASPTSLSNHLAAFV